MRSVRYFGPLGGMVLAFGAGVAILAGAGVASADTDDPSSASASSSEASESSERSESSKSGSESEAWSKATTTTTATAGETKKDDPTGGPTTERTIQLKVSRHADEEVADDDSAGSFDVERQQVSAAMAAADDPPPADSSDEPVAPAVARHEPFAYTPDVKVDDGVVTGTNTASREFRLAQPADLHRRRRPRGGRQGQSRRRPKATSRSCRTPPS